MKKFIKEKFNIFNKINHYKGYALLFTVILVSIISLISFGLSNTTYKQLMLASGARDSQEAFYQSDMAMDCALYIDNQTSLLASGAISTTCGIDNNGTLYKLDIGSTTSSSITTYTLKPPDNILNSKDSCFNIEIKKDNSSPNKTTTTILANGYNICNENNNRTVERTIQVEY